MHNKQEYPDDHEECWVIHDQRRKKRKYLTRIFYFSMREFKRHRGRKPRRWSRQKPQCKSLNAQPEYDWVSFWMRNLPQTKTAEIESCDDFRSFYANNESL